MNTQQCKCESQSLSNFCSNCGASLKPDIFDLVKAADYEELKQALEEYNYDLEVKNMDGWTALFFGANYGKTECLRLLLDHKANIEAKDDYGYTALMLATIWGYVELLKLLLEHKANIEAKNDHGDTALILAARNGNVECLELLLERGAQVDPKTRETYPQYADLWPKDKPNLTPLLEAVENIKQRLSSLEGQIKQMQ